MMLPSECTIAPSIPVYRRSTVSAAVLLVVFVTLPCFAQQSTAPTFPAPQHEYLRIEDMRQQARALSIGELLELARDSLDAGETGFLSRAILPELRRRILADEDTQAMLGVVGRRHESDSMRAFIIHAIRPLVATLRLESQRDLWVDTTRIGLDSPALSTELRVPAVLCANDLVVTLSQAGALTRCEIEQHAQRLDRLMMVATEDHHLRRGIALLRYTRAVPQLLTLLRQEEVARDPVLARSLSIALADLGATEAVERLGGLLESTADPAIFASAACALGDLSTAKALGFLVKNAERYPGGSCGVAIGRQKHLVLTLLDQDGPDVLTAIRATKYLYKEQDKKTYTAMLIALLRSVKDDLQIAAILNRLLDVATRTECTSIVDLVPRRSTYSEEWDAVHRRSIAVKLRPGPSHVPVDEH